MTCDECLRLIEVDAATDAEKVAVMRHLSECPACWQVLVDAEAALMADPSPAVQAALRAVDALAKMDADLLMDRLATDAELRAVMPKRLPG